MAKAKRFSGMQKFLIVAGLLILFQLVFILAFSKDNAQTIRDAIQKAVEDQSELTPERREQLRIQLALADYMLANDNKAPGSLDDLVPKYFDTIPTNPKTGKPFEYQIMNTRPVVGDPSTMYAEAIRGGPDGAKTGIERASTEEEDNLLIASLSDPLQSATYVYDPTGKRDPFLPFNFALDTGGDQKTALEKYTIGQLKVTAILAGFDEPTAIVEDESGKGFPITKGTKIGPFGGEVVEILKDRVLILETTKDFTGQAKTRTIEMKLRLPDDKNKR